MAFYATKAIYLCPQCPGCMTISLDAVHPARWLATCLDCGTVYEDATPNVRALPPLPPGWRQVKDEPQRSEVA